MRKIQREPNGDGIFSPGQDLVMAGFVGKGGVKAVLERHGAILEARYSAFYMEGIRKAAAETLNMTPEILSDCGATEWEYVTEGGVFAALWNLSGAYERGFSVDLRRIPVSQELIEVCELFDLNPYRLLSGECVLMAADHGGDLVRELSERNISAVVVGKAERGIARKIVTSAGIGFLERPQPDEVHKIEGIR